jgi:hypothetical protein
VAKQNVDANDNITLYHKEQRMRRGSPKKPEQEMGKDKKDTGSAGEPQTSAMSVRAAKSQLEETSPPGLTGDELLAFVSQKEFTAAVYCICNGKWYNLSWQAFSQFLNASAVSSKGFFAAPN